MVPKSHEDVLEVIGFGFIQQVWIYFLTLVSLWCLILNNFQVEKNTNFFHPDEMWLQTLGS